MSKPEGLEEPFPDRHFAREGIMCERLVQACMSALGTPEFEKACTDLQGAARTIARLWCVLLAVRGLKGDGSLPPDDAAARRRHALILDLQVILHAAARRAGVQPFTGVAKSNSEYSVAMFEAELHPKSGT